MMMRDYFIPLSELLFWFTDGELLVNTPWFFVWLFVGALVTVTPVWAAMQFGRRGSALAWIPGVVFLIAFFPMLIVITAPGIVQMDFLEECLPVQTVTVDTDLVESLEVRVRHCRFKDNRYDNNYGSWQAFIVNQK
jgi:hypothetical protein